MLKVFHKQMFYAICVIFGVICTISPMLPHSHIVSIELPSEDNVHLDITLQDQNGIPMQHITYNNINIVQNHTFTTSQYLSHGNYTVIAIINNNEVPSNTYVFNITLA